MLNHTRRSSLFELSPSFKLKLKILSFVNRVGPRPYSTWKSAGKVLASFSGIKTASSSLIIFQRAKLSTWSITHLCWCNRRTYWRENANSAGKSPRGSCSCTTMLQLTGHLQPRRNWPTWASSVLITHSILRIWPRRTTTCSLDWKKQLKVGHFSSDAEVIAAAETWLDGQPSECFLGGLQKLEKRAKKCIELRGECAEQILSLVAFWSG